MTTFNLDGVLRRPKRTAASSIRSIALSPHNRMKIGSVIRTADQRTRRDIEKTFFARDVAVIIELLRRDVFNDRQVLRTWAQVLTDGQDFAADLAQIVHGLKKFRLLFAKTEHHAALCDHAW